MFCFGNFVTFGKLLNEWLMKNLLYILFSAFFIAQTVSCGGSSAESSGDEKPSDVALSLFNSVEMGDFDGVRYNICFSSEKDEALFESYLERAEKFAKGKDKSIGVAGFEVVSEEVKGDSALVTLKGKDAFGKEQAFIVPLVRKSSGWKVDGSTSLLHRK